LSSRLFGFVRQSLIGSLFGVGRHADVLAMAFRGPNLLQNLLGEQTLSASFIPIYSRMLEEGRDEDARRFAGGVFGLLVTLAAGVSLGGVLLAEPFVALFAPGFLTDAAEVAAGTATVDRYALAVRAVRLIFPMTAFLVLSAWSLGILNSHRRFFLPYFAPVFWNLSIITALLLFRPEVTTGADLVTGLERLLFAVCGGALVGGFAQFLVQLPLALRLLGGFRPALSLAIPGVREAIRAFVPLLAGRGVVQLSGYLDIVLASLLSGGSVGSLAYAQTLYLLPISLFGMSVAATTLPELSRESGSEARPSFFRRLDRGLLQMLFLTVPTAVGYLGFGFLIVGLVYRRGVFGIPDNWLVFLVLAGYSLGMIAASTSRLLNNAFFAIGETKTPARVAVERVLLSASIGVLLMLQLDAVELSQVTSRFGGDPVGDSVLRLGALGLSAAAGLSAWYELGRLIRRMRASFPEYRLPWGPVLQYVAASLVAALPALGVWWLVRQWHPSWIALIVLPIYPLTYLALTRLLGISRLSAWLGKAPKGE